MNPSFILYNPDAKNAQILIDGGYNIMTSDRQPTFSQFEMMKDPNNKFKTLFFDENFDYYIPRDWEKRSDDLKMLMWYVNDTLKEVELRRIGDYFSEFMKTGNGIKFSRNEGLLEEFTKPCKIQKSEKFTYPEKRKAIEEV